MPATSKNQQRAAAIALKAKREGTVSKLPKGSASKSMASMSEKELKKYASTKRKGLPKKANESALAETWEESCMVREEMLGVEPGEIATDNSKVDRLEDEDHDTKSYKDSWTSAVNAVASHSRSPMTTNTRGARVAEEAVPQSIDMLSEEMKLALVKMKIQGEGAIKSNRWQELAGLSKSESTLLQEGTTWFERYDDETSDLLSEMDSSQLKRYVIRMAKHGWGWEKDFEGGPGIADKLTNDYGVTPSELRDLKKVYDEEMLDQEKYNTMYNESQNEAVVGGVSNSSPNPGHRAKMNENNDSPEREECLMCGGEVDPHDEACVECGFVNPPQPTRAYPQSEPDNMFEFNVTECEHEKTSDDDEADNLAIIFSDH